MTTVTLVVCSVVPVYEHDDQYNKCYDRGTDSDAHLSFQRKKGLAERVVLHPSQGEVQIPHSNLYIQKTGHAVMGTMYFYESLLLFIFIFHFENKSLRCHKMNDWNQLINRQVYPNKHADN